MTTVKQENYFLSEQTSNAQINDSTDSNLKEDLIETHSLKTNFYENHNDMFFLESWDW